MNPDRLSKWEAEMRCSKAHRLMSISLDQELSVKEQTILASHLGHCEPCREAFQTLRETRRCFTLAEQFSAPPGFSRRVMTRLGPAPRPHPLLRLLFARCAEVAVILLVVGIGVVFGRFADTSTGMPQPGKEASFLSLALFDPAPSDSLGGAYLAMTEGGNEQ